MSTINKILIPFDFSEASVNALEYTMNFVGPNRDTDILALYVGVIPSTENEEKELKENFRKVLGSFNVKTKKEPVFNSVSGNVIETILVTQINQKTDLIIMGTMGDKTTDEAITHTSKLVLEANCPVISIPYGCEIKQPKQIALVMGKEEIEDKEVLNMLLNVARTFNSKVHVLTIYKESVYAEEAIVDRTENLLEYYLEHFYTEHSFSKNEDIEQGILDYINGKDIDLLAILPRNHSVTGSPSEGRLTKLLTLHSEIPVLALD
ncbi:universal stress protein [Flagellimonas meridianipacifica]|uniref:Universal stress protein family protein n=1 Tax=Flagellimonas meridianipacifica TaxID=1080225 RepID=A0A2T0MJ72_9FLAO|nr:universal stress protein [Allomuricauda pacifica]PRX57632.1 universal stress protein family protein [Allomuricauda pacifica]